MEDMRKENIKSDKFSRKTTWSVAATVALFFGIVFPYVCTATSVNDIAKSATSLKANSVFFGTFDNSGDVDHFKIKLRTDGILTIWAYSGVDTKASLENRYYRIAEDDNKGPGDNFLISQYLEAGIYYISVSVFDCGSAEFYALRSTFVPEMFGNGEGGYVDKASGYTEEADTLEITEKDADKLAESADEIGDVLQKLKESLEEEKLKIIEDLLEDLMWRNYPPINDPIDPIGN